MKSRFLKYFSKSPGLPASSGNINFRIKAELKKYLAAATRETLSSKLAYQAWMFRQEDLNSLVDDALLLTIDDLYKAAVESRHDFKKIVSENSFFATCKKRYLELLFRTWAENHDNTRREEVGKSTVPIFEVANFDYHFKSAALSALDMMEIPCRHLFTWQYVDQFSMEQISTITGKSPALLIEDFWTCFRSAELICRSKLGLPPHEVCTKEQYNFLHGYFNNLITTGEETEMIHNIRQDKLMQYNFQLFLSLKFESSETPSVNLLLKPPNKEGLSADEFIDLVRRELEDPSTPE